MLSSVIFSPTILWIFYSESQLTVFSAIQVPYTLNHSVSIRSNQCCKSPWAWLLWIFSGLTWTNTSSFISITSTLLAIRSSVNCSITVWLFSSRMLIYWSITFILWSWARSMMLSNGILMNRLGRDSWIWI